MFRIALSALTCLLFLSGGNGLAEETLAQGETFVLNGDTDRGKQVYKTFCTVCHGENGDGKGPAAVALNPKPANYRDAKHMNTLSDQYLHRVVSEGGPAVGKSILMASWKAVLSDQQIRDVVAFVRTFSQSAK